MENINKIFHTTTLKNKEVIVYYISSHGFGHLTRCMAQIERKLEGYAVNYKYLLICGENQIGFAKKYFKKYSDNIIYKILDTDVGLINKPNSLEIDKLTLERNLEEFINSWDKIVENEINELSQYKIKEIISDISPIGILVAKKLGLEVKLISNFTWYQQYRHLNLNKNIIEEYLMLDNLIDTLYRYQLYLDFDHINPKIIDEKFISRIISNKRANEIKEKYGRSIFISVGKSAELKKIEVQNFEGTIFITSGIKVESILGNVYELPIDIDDTQNYIAASELIIAKAGWGTIGEAMCADKPIVLIERDGVLEDTHNIKMIKKMKKGVSITVKELKKIDFNTILKKLNEVKNEL